MSDEDRYVYCLVDTGEESDPSIDATGIDKEPVEVFSVDRIGVVMHACDGLYDAHEEDRVRRRHQESSGRAISDDLIVRSTGLTVEGVRLIRKLTERYGQEAINV